MGLTASAFWGKSSSSSSRLSLLVSASSRPTPRKDFAALPLLAAEDGTSLGHEHYNSQHTKRQCMLHRDKANSKKKKKRRGGGAGGVFQPTQHTIKNPSTS